MIMRGFNATITYWNSAKDGLHGHAQIEGRQSVVGIDARGAVTRTGKSGTFDQTDVTTKVPERGEKIFIPLLTRYVWRTGGKKKGYGYVAPCWVRSA